MLATQLWVLKPGGLDSSEVEWVIGLARSLTTAGAPHGIKVNLVAPAAFTRMAGQPTDEPDSTRPAPGATQMSPDLVAPMVAFLAHEDCPLSGAIYEMFGLGHRIYAARVVQAFTGTAAVALVAAIGWMLWGRMVGLVGAAIAAIYPPLVYVGESMYSEAVFVPLMLASVAAGITRKSTSRSERAGATRKQAG